jgi:hypothetical protein
MAGYVTREVLLNGSSVVLGASETNTVVSENHRIGCELKDHQMVAISAASVTAGAGITAKLQHSWDGGSTFIDVTSASVAITADGVFHIATQTQLYPIQRVVVTTGAGSAATINSVVMLRD